MEKRPLESRGQKSRGFLLSCRWKTFTLGVLLLPKSASEEAATAILCGGRATKSGNSI